jgi:hypothetical protein
MKLIISLGLLLAAVQAHAKSQYGEPITLKQEMSLAELLKAYPNGSKSEILTSGTVDSVCEKKGCWMVLSDGAQQARITFKGYKYFVPVSLRGQQIQVQGVFEEKTVSVAKQKHYLEDAKAGAAEIAKITEPQKTLHLVASGVRIKK